MMIALTPEQVASVIQQGGAIQVRADMTVGELLRVIAPNQPIPATFVEPPARMPVGPVSPIPLPPPGGPDLIVPVQGGCPGGVCPAPQQGGFRPFGGIFRRR